MFTQKASSEQK